MSIENDILRSLDFNDLIADFAMRKVRKRVFWTVLLIVYMLLIYYISVYMSILVYNIVLTIDILSSFACQINCYNVINMSVNFYSSLYQYE